MILVIQTQDYENYGAHDWDGKGACPQYWKAKGGSEIKVTGVDPALYTEAQIIDMIRDEIEQNNDFIQTTIIGASFEQDGYLSWFEKSQLEYEGEITFREPEIEFDKVVGRWLNMEDPMAYANAAADADAVYYGA